jgi:hypothetical protein
VPFPAFLDTCVLYPAYLADTLLRLAEASAYRPLWSADVLAELRRNVIERGIPPSSRTTLLLCTRMSFCWTSLICTQG